MGSTSRSRGVRARVGRCSGFLGLASLAACVSPIALHRAVLEYDRTVGRVETELLLLNIARARHHHPLHFTVMGRGLLLDEGERSTLLLNDPRQPKPMITIGEAATDAAGGRSSLCDQGGSAARSAVAFRGRWGSISRSRRAVPI